MTGRFVNEILSFIVFTLLDILDFLLCYVYKILDYLIEAEWKPCYCSSAKEAITSSGKILVSEHGESKILHLTSTKLQLEEISDTLYNRPSLVSEVSKSTVEGNSMIQSRVKINKRGGTTRSTFTVNSTIVEMLQGRIQTLPIPRWSDCDCNTCTGWTSCKESLFIKADGAKGNKESWKANKKQFYWSSN